MNSFEEALGFVKKHKGDKRQPSGPLFMWEHAFQVAQYLTSVLQETGEIEESRMKTLQYVALGHDLLEDTACTPEEIANRWGDEVLRFITLLSNMREDGYSYEIMETLGTVNEEVFIVKLADTYANLKNSIANFEESDKNFLLEKWPHFLKKYKKLLNRTVTSHGKTIHFMINEITPLITACEDKIEELREENESAKKEIKELIKFKNKKAKNELTKFIVNYKSYSDDVIASAIKAFETLVDKSDLIVFINFINQCNPITYESSVYHAILSIHKVKSPKAISAIKSFIMDYFKNRGGAYKYEELGYASYGGQYYDEGAMKAIKLLYELDEKSALMILIQYAEKFPEDFCCIYYEDEAEESPMWIIDALGILRSKESVGVLVKLLYYVESNFEFEDEYSYSEYYEYEDIITRIINSLGKIGAKEAVPILQEELRNIYEREYEELALDDDFDYDEDYDNEEDLILKSIIIALGEIGDASSEPLLRKIIGNKFLKGYATYATEALKKLSTEEELN